MALVRDPMIPSLGSEVMMRTGRRVKRRVAVLMEVIPTRTTTELRWMRLLWTIVMEGEVMIQAPPTYLVMLLCLVMMQAG